MKHERAGRIYSRVAVGHGGIEQLQWSAGNSAACSSEAEGVVRHGVAGQVHDAADRDRVGGGRAQSSSVDRETPIVRPVIGGDLRRFAAAIGGNGDRAGKEAGGASLIEEELDVCGERNGGRVRWWVDSQQ